MNLESLIEKRQLGRDAGLITLETRAENRLICTHMAGQARHELCLFSRDLDKSIYDHVPFLDAVKSLALHSRTSRIRILLQDHERVIKYGHRFIELARHLSSSAEIRVPHGDWLSHAENFMLADRYGYVHRELSTRYEATADYHDPLAVQHMQNSFEEIWESAQVDLELRRLYL